MKYKAAPDDLGSNYRSAAYSLCGPSQIPQFLCGSVSSYIKCDNKSRVPV